MNFLEAILLGILQGLTEFLPVSSSGHIELGKSVLGVKFEDDLLFSLVVHAATALSTIVIFRKDIVEISRGLFKFKYNAQTEYVFKIAISMIPLGIAYLVFKEEIEQLFEGQILIVGSMLIITGIVLALTYYSGDKGGDVSYGKAVLIGIAQTIAILPGISRSGSTIAVALLLGVDKVKAAQFSFLMVLAPIIGATLLKLKDFIAQPASEIQMESMPLLAGFIAAFVSGLIACGWMIKIVKKGKLIYFAVYCFLVGTLAIILNL